MTPNTNEWLTDRRDREGGLLGILSNKRHQALDAINSHDLSAYGDDVAIARIAGAKAQFMLRVLEDAIQRRDAAPLDQAEALDPITHLCDAISVIEQSQNGYRDFDARRVQKGLNRGDQRRLSEAFTKFRLTGSPTDDLARLAVNRDARATRNMIAGGALALTSLGLFAAGNLSDKPSNDPPPTGIEHVISADPGVNGYQVAGAVAGLAAMLLAMEGWARNWHENREKLQQVSEAMDAFLQEPIAATVTPERRL